MKILNIFLGHVCKEKITFSYKCTKGMLKFSLLPPSYIYLYLLCCDVFKYNYYLILILLLAPTQPYLKFHLAYQ